MTLDFPRLIKDLAVNLQQPLMEPVKDACRISWDTVDMHVYLHQIEGKEVVILCLDIGELPKQNSEELSVLMLQGNYLWIASEYATLSINPENQQLAICDKIHSEHADVETLTTRVRKLYQTAIYWQEIIADSVSQAGNTYLEPQPANGFAIKV